MQAYVKKMDEKQISMHACRILRKIGKPIIFAYPTYPQGKLQGTLIDRVIMHTRSISQIKDFFDVIDLACMLGTRDDYSQSLANTKSFNFSRSEDANSVLF